MVEWIISIGKKLGMSILAEGVETIEQKELLKKNNCDIFQGYLYSKPLKILDLKLFIKTINKLWEFKCIILVSIGFFLLLINI